MKKFKEFLFESPMFIPNELPRQPFGELSKSDFEKKYIVLYEIFKFGFLVIKHKTKNTILVIRKINDDLNYFIYVSYKFNDYTKFLKHQVPFKKSILTKLVIANSETGKMGAAKELYISMAQHYPVVSDNTHYIGGKELWDFLAKMSKSKGLIVKVWGGREGVWLKDDMGNETYDGTNFDESTIWSLDSSKMSTVLVLMNKNLN